MVVLLPFASWGQIFDNWIYCYMKEAEAKVVEAVCYISIPDTSENCERLGRIYVWRGISSDLIVMQ
jgi:hypothetical protein